MVQRKKQNGLEKDIRAWKQAVAIVSMVGGLISKDAPSVTFEGIFGPIEPKEPDSRKKDLLNAMEWGVKEFGIAAPGLEELKKEVDENATEADGHN